MNKDVVKYGLIGAAIYFAWPYLSGWLKGMGIGGGGVPAAPGGTTAPGTTAQPPVTTPPIYNPPASTPPTGTTPDAANAAVLAATDNETVKRGAASGQSLWVGESDRRGIKLDHHNWNWYRALVTGQTQPDPEQWAPGQTTIPVLVSEYLRMRTAAGVAGLGELIHPALMWVA